MAASALLIALLIVVVLILLRRWRRARVQAHNCRGWTPCSRHRCPHWYLWINDGRSWRNDHTGEFYYMDHACSDPPVADYGGWLLADDGHTWYRPGVPGGQYEKYIAADGWDSPPEVMRNDRVCSCSPLCKSFGTDSDCDHIAWRV